MSERKQGPAPATGQANGHRRAHLQILETEFQRRKSKNPRYSLRAFSSQLEIHPSAMSRIFAGKQDLSLAGAREILKRLTLNESEKRTFILSVAEEKYVRAVTLLAADAGIDCSVKGATPIDDDSRD